MTDRKLLLNKFFDLSPPSMRKGNSGERRKRAEEKSGEKTDENSDHYKYHYFF